MTHLFPIHLSLGSFVWFELVGGAALAIWVTARFPKLGPASLKTAAGLSVAAAGVLHLLPLAVRLVARLPQGAYVALFGCVLPAAFVAFLAAAWLLRLLANAAGTRAY